MKSRAPTAAAAHRMPRPALILEAPALDVGPVELGSREAAALVGGIAGTGVLLGVALA